MSNDKLPKINRIIIVDKAPITKSDSSIAKVQQVTKVEKKPESKAPEAKEKKEVVGASKTSKTSNVSSNSNSNNNSNSDIKVETVPVVGKMSITVKMTRLPKSHNKLENDICEFSVDMQPMEIVIRTPGRTFGKFFRALKEAYEWVAIVEGKVSEIKENQIIIDDAKIFTVHKVLKPITYIKIAESIARELMEENVHSVRLIRTLVERFGVKDSYMMVKQAKEIYEGEGIWLENKERKRTLGGVFFFLVKAKMSKEEWIKVSYGRTVKQTAKEQQQGQGNQDNNVSTDSVSICATEN